MKNQWVRAGLFLLFLFVASRWVPPHPVDPWGLFRPQKILFMFFALSALQVVGKAFSIWIGRKAGVILTGFLGGLLSSTATTVTLAKESHEPVGSQTLRLAALQSAILAMLVQAAVLIRAGGIAAFELVGLHFAILSLITLSLIGLLWRRKPQSHPVIAGTERILDIRSSLKLTVFIVLILSASKLVQEWAGSQGLMILTFVISLFEVHGSLISTSQLLAAGKVDGFQYERLVEASLMASYVSKFALVATISSSGFRKKALMTLAPGMLFILLHLTSR
ncbi:hypothetical protein Bb109J_c1201 [Bdellovibrio bacteriovorus]|uniref:DUF4010 domain-containing protein n=2 Tax=Bdellovibrio bacteriovorus TaxID=959 RepID=Q6MNC6_BDEBA|nr:hypothetical protein EP01_16570 [Bdellovibrio bacteriovorus]BEV67781.1 hypothetical protein Bb109J_c1201 [Bdellovibrio bacteriovorus]CAE79226.1 conserved hypothetical protein [Bdellovibrio bacteriovorus HD100]